MLSKALIFPSSSGIIEKKLLYAEANGNNYFLKSILLNDNSKISKLKDGKDNILKDEFQFFLVYKNI